MTYYQYTKTLRSEIDDLNRIIDQKIVRGLSYRRESLRHKQLIREMRRSATRRSKSGGLSNFLSFVSLF
jgi:hypothetical protein